uniref:Uncharacterized protein n=1 Tax=Arundo donax TaxID=35708 RepID=A0A0A9V5L3_ARUDO
MLADSISPRYSTEVQQIHMTDTSMNMKQDVTLIDQQTYSK